MDFKFTSNVKVYLCPTGFGGFFSKLFHMITCQRYCAARKSCGENKKMLSWRLRSCKIDTRNVASHHQGKKVSVLQQLSHPAFLNDASPIGRPAAHYSQNETERSPGETSPLPQMTTNVIMHQQGICSGVETYNQSHY